MEGLPMFILRLATEVSVLWLPYKEVQNTQTATVKPSACCCCAGELGQWERVLQRLQQGVQHVLFHQEAIHSGGRARRGAGKNKCITSWPVALETKGWRWRSWHARCRRARGRRGDGKSSTSSSRLSESFSVLRRASARTAPCCRSPTCPTSTKCSRGAKCERLKKKKKINQTCCSFICLCCK